VSSRSRASLKRKQKTSQKSISVLTHVERERAANLSIIKVLKSFTNSELKIETYEIFRPFFNRTSSVNDMNVKKMNFKKGVLTPLRG